MQIGIVFLLVALSAGYLLNLWIRNWVKQTSGGCGYCCGKEVS